MQLFQSVEMSHRRAGYGCSLTASNKLMVQVGASSLFGASWMPQEDYRRGAVPEEPELPTKQVQ
jgi:hypothetical protein